MKIEYLGENYFFPDFIIVGAAKSGTTSFYNYLCHHPRVFMPQKKELWFLHLVSNPNKEILTRYPGLPVTIKDYSSHFNNSRNDQLLGEATPSYLIFPDYTIQNIKRYNPQYRKTKIIILLREPIDKIVSLYKFNLKIRTEYLDINNALKEEKNRRESNKMSIGFNYVESSLYYKQVKLFKDNFDDVLVFTFEEFKEELEKVLTTTADFLGIDAEPILENPLIGKKFNTTDFIKPNGQLQIVNLEFIKSFIKYLPKSFFKPNFLKKQIAFFKYLTTTKKDIDSERLKYLNDIFREDVEKLQSLLGKDFSGWISKY